MHRRLGSNGVGRYGPPCARYGIRRAIRYSSPTYADAGGTDVVIHVKFAKQIAYMYVNIYQEAGFVAAQEYLDMMVKGDVELRDYLVPLIVEEGLRRK